MSLNSYPWTAYQQTHVEVYLPEGVKVLEQVDGNEVGVWPFEYTEVWILTACNPKSQELSPADNNQRHKVLGEQLAELGLNYFTPEVLIQHQIHQASGVKMDMEWLAMSASKFWSLPRHGSKTQYLFGVQVSGLFWVF
jgi:hypothetical protein